jgi:hypothetical protein
LIMSRAGMTARVGASPMPRRSMVATSQSVRQ